MKIVFRVDASTLMGIGHLMRCIALAEALRKRDVQAHFICREHTGNLISLLQQKNILVTVLPAPVIHEIKPDENYAVWLGVTQTEDAAQTIETLQGEMTDWLVVDHYGLDIEWEKRLRPYVRKLMVIDDLANRRHDCDLLLDQNYVVDREHHYTGLIPDTCNLLLGPHYALLHAEYAAYRKKLRVRDGSVKRVLVFFGGSDPQNMTGTTLEALSAPHLNDLEIDVVIGPNHAHREALEYQAKKRGHTTIHGSRSHLADLILQADIAVGAGGITTWERMCLGLPSIVVSISENQRPASQALSKTQFISYAGHFSEVNTSSMTQQISQFVDNYKKLSEMSVKNQLQVDGLGALRLAEKLFPSNLHEIHLRPACAEDMILYYNWANDPDVRKNSMNTSAISWDTHQGWFMNKLCDANSHLFVLEAGGLPVGQIRFDKQSDEAMIDYSLDKFVRGRGWGEKLIALGTERMQKLQPMRLRATVRAGNETSRAVFLRMGFMEDENILENEYKSFYLNLSDR